MTRRRVLIAIGFVAVLCAALGLFSLRMAEDIRSTESASNLAAVDGVLSTEVEGEVATALNQVLSFDSDALGPTQAAAERVLTGDAAEDYDTILTDLEKRSQGQQLTMSTRVAVVGVRELSQETASLLVFLDQSSVRKADDSSNVAAAQLSITAVKREGAWLISDLEVL